MSARSFFAAVSLTVAILVKFGAPLIPLLMGVAAAGFWLVRKHASVNR